MTRLERYRQQLDELRAKYHRLNQCGKYMQAQRLMNEILNVEKQIKEAEDYEAKPLVELVGRDKVNESNLVTLMLEAHLAADFLTDCTFNIKSTVQKLGLRAVTIVPELEEIRKKSNEFAERLMSISSEFNDLMIEDETLIDALHKKTLSYIKQRLTKAKKNGAKRQKSGNGVDD